MSRNYASSSDYSVVDVSVAETLPISAWCWAKPDDLTSDHWLMFLGDKDTTDHLLFMALRGATTDGLQVFHHGYGGTAKFVDSSNSYNVDAWNGCGGVFVSNSSRICYLNGTKTPNSDSGPNSPTTHDRTAIGWLGDSSPSYSGGCDIAHAAVWPGVQLSDLEFAALQAGYHPSFIRPGIVKYWDLVRTDRCNDPTYDLSTTGSSYTDSPSNILFPSAPQAITLNPFNQVRADILAGLDAASSPATGWNDEVRDKEVVASVVRTSSTVVTITLSTAASYNIGSQEVITATIPATALAAFIDDLTATPTFTVDTAGAPPAGIQVLRRRRESA